MQFQDLVKKAKEIKKSYTLLNRSEGYKTWGVEEYAQGFVGDVGDLIKLVMAKKGLRFKDENIDDKLAHELADCLWSIIIIAEELNIDLEHEFVRNMNQLQQKISGRKVLKTKRSQTV